MLPVYDQPLFRPPSEGRSLIFQVTLGCSWNKCTFCEMYTSKSFATRPFADIEKEIKEAAVYQDVEKVFLADGDALVLSKNKLFPILDLLQKTFPHLQQISSYAMPANLLNKSASDLKEIREHGLSMLYYGVESGDDVILEKIQKGATAAETTEGIKKAKEAGFTVSTTNLIGVGGKKYSKQHALNTAKVLSAADPDFISFLMVMFPLGEERFRKAFGDDYEPLEQVALIEELGMILENLNVTNAEIRSNHASNYLPIKAHFPEDKDQTVALIQQVLADPHNAPLRPERLRGL